LGYFVIVVELIAWLVALAAFHILAVYMLEKSQELIQFWKQRLFKKQARKELKALVPIGFCVGPFFVYKRSILCDLISNAIDYSLTLVFVTR